MHAANHGILVRSRRQYTDAKVVRRVRGALQARRVHVGRARCTGRAILHLYRAGPRSLGIAIDFVVLEQGRLFLS